jgi:hypothetical protein
MKSGHEIEPVNEEDRPEAAFLDVTLFLTYLGRKEFFLDFLIRDRCAAIPPASSY